MAQITPIQTELPTARSSLHDQASDEYSSQEDIANRFLRMARQKLSGPMTAFELASLFSDWSEQLTDLIAPASYDIPNLFADGWDDDEPIPVRISTGVPFIDGFLDGGQVRGESYGLLGTSGGGKTTIALMLTIEAAKAAYNDWCKGGGTGVPDRVYHVTYQEPFSSLRIRALSYVSRIPRKRLSKIVAQQSYGGFSTPGNLRDYEKKMYAKTIAEGRPMLCETERFERAKLVLSHSWRIIDFTGLSANSRAVGAGRTEEIASYVKQDMRRHMVSRCRMVLADDVLSAAYAHVEWFKKNFDELPGIINRWPAWMKRRIAIPLNCPAWSVHYLNVAANNVPGSLPKFSDSVEGHRFAAACDCCFAGGEPKRDGTLLFIGGRYRGTPKMPPVEIKIHDNRCSLKKVHAD